MLFHVRVKYLVQQDALVTNYICIYPLSFASKVLLLDESHCYVNLVESGVC